MALLDQLLGQIDPATLAKLSDPNWQAQQQSSGQTLQYDNGTATYSPLYGPGQGSVDSPTQGPLTGYLGINDASTSGDSNVWSVFDANGNPTGGTQTLTKPKGDWTDMIPLVIAGIVTGGMALGGAGAAGIGAEAGGAIGGTTVGDVATQAARATMGAAGGGGFTGAASDAAFNAALTGGAGSGFAPAASDAAFNTALGGGTTAGSIGSSGATYLGDSTGFAPAASNGAFNSAIGGAVTAAGGFSSASPLLSALGSGVRGITDLIDGSKLNNTANNIADKSDPFAQYRPFFGNELMQLYQHPENVTKIPGYQAGLTAVERSMASQGFNGSGNMMASLQQYGGNFYDKAMQQLSGLSGANQTPGAGLVDAAKITSASQGVTAAGIGELIKSAGALFS